ncbi:MAG: DUF2750 domain-containing protein [Verrucomicrobiota bacterium]
MSFQDSKTVQSNHERFIRHVIANETVYFLVNDDGVANSSSNDQDQTDVLPFWSHLAYAARAARSFEENYETETIELFDFLYRWLPGMSGDGVLAGTNWDANLIGREIDPYILRTELEEKMSPELLEKYEAKYDALSTDA